jgi:hypothetical protein
VKGERRKRQALRLWLKVVIGSLLMLGAILGYAFLRPLTSDGPPFIDSAERVTVDELVQKYVEVGSPILPTWMSGEAQLVEILYVGRTAILIYGEDDLLIEDEDDLLDGEVVIEITPTLSQGYSAKDPLGKRVVRVGDLRVVIDENAYPGPRWRKHGMRPVIAEFHSDGFRYILTARKGRTTPEELLQVIEGMGPIGPRTMRKN